MFLLLIISAPVFICNENFLGELYSLLSLIRKKVQKGKSLAQTAEELENTEENLRLFYETVRKNPEDTVEQLAERLMKKEEII